MEDKELLIRQSVLLEAVIKKVDVIETKIDDINDDQIRQLDKSLGIIQEKVGRLEKIIYGAIAVIFSQTVALVILWLQKK